MQDKVLKTLIFGVIFFLTILALIGLWSYVSVGEEGWSGGRYIHGDWLINVHGDVVRRGLLGSLVLLVSDTLGVNAIPSLTIFMTLLFIILSSLTLRLLLMLKEPAAAVLLLASPAFFLVFWAAEPNAAFRKDLLIYCAMAALVFAAATRRESLLVVSAGFFTLCALGHEFTLLWLPVFLTVLLSAAQDGQLNHTRTTAVAMMVVVAATTAWHVSFPSVGAPDLICAPLLERGIAPSICDGSIRFLGDDVAGARAGVLTFVSGAPLSHFALAYMLSLLPLLAYAWLSQKRAFAVAVVLLCGLPFLPLFFVAVDWGRWMAFHVTSATFLMIHYSLSGRLTLRQDPPVWAALTLLVLATLWSPTTNMEISRGGVLSQVGDTVGRLLRSPTDL